MVAPSRCHVLVGDQNGQGRRNQENPLEEKGKIVLQDCTVKTALQFEGRSNRL